MNKRQNINNLNYNKSLKKFASQLRKNMTKSESCLWKYVLSAGQMKGYTFNRQRPVLNFIADFMCKDLMIIIELDGITHHSESAIKNDEKKDEKLREIGFTILRFSDNEVLNHLNMVVETIDSCIEQKQKERLKSTKQES
jgi:very-short-patch-repair endonuclease